MTQPKEIYIEIVSENDTFNFHSFIKGIYSKNTSIDIIAIGDVQIGDIWRVDEYDCSLLNESQIIEVKNVQYYKGIQIKKSEEHFNSLIEEKDKEILRLKEVNECHKECFEKFMPTEYWDEATEFISTYGSGLSKALLNKER